MLHEPYCLRTYKFCDECKNVIEISEFDEHNLSHSKIKSEPKNETTLNKKKQDAKPIPQDKVISLKDLDFKRFESLKITCEYCDLIVPDSEFNDHEAMCGARSTICEYCNKKMLMKDLIKHLDKCQEKILLEQNAYEDDFYGKINEFNFKMMLLI